jgi:class 3 adenylate cyclase
MSKELIPSENNAWPGKNRQTHQRFLCDIGLMNTILLVDDDKAVRSTFGVVLRHKGYRVIEADSGLTGYELAQQESPDLIITDISMAGGGGEALLHFIRSDPQLCHKQVVLMSGDPDLGIPRKSMEAGADDFLIKPVTLNNLLGCVEARLKRAASAHGTLIEKWARHQRNIERFVLSATGETQTPTFTAWANGERVTLAIVFTDVVGSTKLCEEISDEGMKEVRRRHFAQSRKLIHRYGGREIKTIGDSFMAAFRCAEDALYYAMDLQEETGHGLVHIRAAIHIGPMHVEDNDVFGGTVNFAARIIDTIKEAEIWLSGPAKEDLSALDEKRARIAWQEHPGIPLKGFPGTWALWSLVRP